MSTTIEDLVRQVDVARARGDTAEIERLDAEIREITEREGPRKITGTLAAGVPGFKYSGGGKKEEFKEWNKPR